MPSWWQRVRTALVPSQQRSTIPDWWPILANGMMYGFPYPQTTLGTQKEELGSSYGALITGAYAANPIVFSCINARVQLFSEARFQFQRLVDGRPGELFAGPSTYLAPLENPWPGGTTSQLLKGALIDADLAGNAFIYRDGRTLQRLRPDWTTIIAGSPTPDANTWDLDVEVLGYGYQPGGPEQGRAKVYLQASQVAHFKSTHDPLRRFSGMSWLVPVMRDISSDQAATSHKLNYFENAATPNLLVKFDQAMTKAQAADWIKLFKEDHVGATHAYKTLFLGGGSDAEVVGNNLRESSFSAVQAAGELRIASAAGVPPIIIGLAGGLEAATYSNYGQARRAFADLTMRPLWRDISGALENIITVPVNARLWYDDRDISFLQEDVKDNADIGSAQAATMRQLVDAGFEPDTIVDAVMAGNDWKRLSHSGLYSVQLQPPQTETTPQLPAGSAAPPQLGANAADGPTEIRCHDCGKLVAKRTAPGGSFEIKCRGCNALVAA